MIVAVALWISMAGTNHHPNANEDAVIAFAEWVAVMPSVEVSRSGTRIAG